MNENVYQHFRKEEHPFIDTVAGWVEQVETQYAPHLTEFLDPRQAYVVETIVRANSNLKLRFFGGYESAERTRAMIYPDYYEPLDADYELELFEIIYPIKFGELSHGKILGTLVNSGIKRDYFGDIISDGIRWQVFVAKNIANYIQTQVTKIGKVKIRLESCDYTQILMPKDAWEIESTTATSLRLDNLISTVYNISRQRSKQMIDTGKVKVNWIENKRPDFVVDLLDIISIRGFGRIQIREIEGKTKKEKHRLKIGVLRK